MGAMDAGQTVQVHNSITQEKEQNEEVRKEATSPLQAHQYGDGSGGEETACCESKEELGGGDSVEELGGGEEDTGSEVEIQDGKQLLRSQYGENSPVKGRKRASKGYHGGVWDHTNHLLDEAVMGMQNHALGLRVSKFTHMCICC